MIAGLLVTGSFMTLFLSAANPLEPRCERITVPMCLKLGYNTTNMPNFIGHNTQKEAILGLDGFEILLQLDCSPVLRLFVCSVFVPLCSEYVPGAVPPCRGLCDKVKSDCFAKVATLGLEWPNELNCSRFPEVPALCIQQPPEEEPPSFPGHDAIEDHSFVPVNQKCHPNVYSSDHGCLNLCLNNDIYKQADRTLYDVWSAAWSLTCLLFTSFALLTFFTQPKRFRWPARPVLYLAFLGFFRSIIFIVRWIIGPFNCSEDPGTTNPTNLTCIGIAVILVLLDAGTALWWAMFCFVWYLSAAKEWSTEAIEKISSRLHGIIWILFIPPFLAVFSENIKVNELTGFCELPGYVLIGFQQFFIIVGLILAMFTSIALKNVREAVLYVGRSPYKLERLMWRLGIISIGICVPLFVSLLCSFFNTVTTLLIGVGLRYLSAIFASLWVFSSKTFKTWNKILRPTWGNKNCAAVPVTKV